MLPNGEGFSRYGLGGGEPLPPPTATPEEPLKFAVPWWDDNLEFAPMHPPNPEDMWWVPPPPLPPHRPSCLSLSSSTIMWTMQSLLIMCDCREDWNLGQSAPVGDIVDTKSWRPPVPTPIYENEPPAVGSQPQAPLPMWDGGTVRVAAAGSER